MVLQNTVEAKYLHWLVVFLALGGRVFLRGYVCSTAPFQVVEAFHLVPFERTQRAVLLQAGRTEERRTLAAEGNGFPSFETALAHRLDLPLRLCHFVVYVFHPLHEESALQLFAVARRKRCVLATLGAGEGPPSRVLRQRLDTCPTVVVIAGEQLGPLVEATAHGARDIFLQLVQSLVVGVWTFGHVFDTREGSCNSTSRAVGDVEHKIRPL